MRCPNCGQDNDELNQFCKKCGSRLEGRSALFDDNNRTDAFTEEQLKAGKQIRLFAILALVLPGAALMADSYLCMLTDWRVTISQFYLVLIFGALIGLILAFFCKSKLRECRNSYHSLPSAAKVAKGLSTAALCLCGVLLVFSAFSFFTFSAEGMGSIPLSSLLDGTLMNLLTGTSAATPTATPVITPTPVPMEMDIL